VGWCLDGDFLAIFCVLYFQRAACSTFQTDGTVDSWYSSCVFRLLPWSSNGNINYATVFSLTLSSSYSVGRAVSIANVRSCFSVYTLNRYRTFMWAKHFYSKSSSFEWQILSEHHPPFPQKQRLIHHHWQSGVMGIYTWNFSNSSCSGGLILYSLSLLMSSGFSALRFLFMWKYFSNSKQRFRGIIALNSGIWQSASVDHYKANFGHGRGIGETKDVHRRSREWTGQSYTRYRKKVVWLNADGCKKTRVPVRRLLSCGNMTRKNLVQ